MVRHRTDMGNPDRLRDEAPTDRRQSQRQKDRRQHAAVMARIMEWCIVREKSRVEQPMCSLRRLAKHETPPDIRTARVEFEVEVRNSCWLVEHDVRDLARDMTHVIAAERAACATEMAGPTALHGEQKARCLDTARRADSSPPPFA